MYFPSIYILVLNKLIFFSIFQRANKVFSLTHFVYRENAFIITLYYDLILSKTREQNSHTVIISRKVNSRFHSNYENHQSALPANCMPSSCPPLQGGLSWAATIVSLDLMGLICQFVWACQQVQMPTLAGKSGKCSNMVGT